MDAIKGALVHVMHLLAGAEGAKDFCARLNDPVALADSADWFRRLSSALDAEDADSETRANNVLKRFYITPLRQPE
jgi:hypothetical protein